MCLCFLTYRPLHTYISICREWWRPSVCRSADIALYDGYVPLCTDSPKSYSKVYRGSVALGRPLREWRLRGTRRSQQGQA